MAVTFKQIRNELLPALASPAWGLREPWIEIDEERDVLLVRDGREVGFGITRAELEDGVYKREWYPRMQMWKERREAKRKEEADADRAQCGDGTGAGG